VALAGLVGSAALAEEASAPDLESLLARRALAPRPQRRALPATVRLVWADPSRAAARLEPVACAEAKGLLRKIGVPVSWRRGGPRELSRPGEVRVILLDRPATRDPGVPVLGATPPVFAVAPFVWVHLPGVRLSLGLDRGPGARMDPLQTHALAVAVGRVIAHEVVHALAPSVTHGTGLMSASLTRRQLTTGSIPVDPEVALAVQAALRGDVPLPRPDTTLAAATAGEEPPR
jgi:hypothetical protein